MQCQRCKVDVSFGFFDLMQEAFCIFDSCFCFAIRLLVPRTPRSVLSCKVGKFLTGKLWTIVTYHNVWNSLSREMALQLLDDSARLCVRKMVDFLEV